MNKRAVIGGGLATIGVAAAAFAAVQSSSPDESVDPRLEPNMPTVADAEQDITLNSADSAKIATYLNGCEAMNDGRGTILYNCGEGGIVRLEGLQGTHSYVMPNDPAAFARASGVASRGSRMVVENKNMTFPMPTRPGSPQNGYNG